MISDQPASRWVLPMAVAVAGVIAISPWVYFLLSGRFDKPAPVVIATPAKEVASVEKVAVPIKAPVTVYKTTPALKKNLSLPAPVVDNDKQAVLASSKVQAGENAHTVTTVIDTETGKSETYVRTDPLPWFAFESRGELGLYYGLKGGQQAVRLQARQDFVQVKALHLGVIGSVDVSAGKPDAFVGVGVAYRW